MESGDINSVRKGKKTLKWLEAALFLLVLDGLWGFVFTRTIYASNTMNYISFISLLILFVIIYQKYKFGKNTSLSIIWTPFLLLVMGGYFFRFTLEHFTYWFICFVMVVIASVAPFYKAIPAKLFFWSGIFAAIGIMIQLFFPSFYYSKIAGVFLNDRAEGWAGNSGYAGFTFQLGTTACILIYAEIFLLYLKDIILNKLVRYKYLYNFLVVFLIICIFLTGKRTISIIALLLPFIVYYASKKMSSKKFLFILLIMVVAIGSFQYFINNLSEFSDNILLRRFVSTYKDADTGEDITSGRTYLYELALKAFNENPLFGVGVGRFKEYTGADTEVHNTYLQVLCEQGILGFAFFIIPIIYCFIFTWRILRKVGENNFYFNYLKLSFALQFFYISYAMTGNLNISYGRIIYFLGIAITISCYKEIKNKKIKYKFNQNHENCNMCK